MALESVWAGVIAVTLAFIPVVALVPARNSLGRLQAATWLAVWGAVIVAGEHAYFAISDALSIAYRPIFQVQAEDRLP